MADFVDRHDLGHLQHLIDADGSLWQRFGITTQPSWVFLNDDGTATARIGGLGATGLAGWMDELAST